MTRYCSEDGRVIFQGTPEGMAKALDQAQQELERLRRPLAHSQSDEPLEITSTLRLIADQIHTERAQGRMLRDQLIKVQSSHAALQQLISVDPEDLRRAIAILDRGLRNAKHSIWQISRRLSVGWNGGNGKFVLYRHRQNHNMMTISTHATLLDVVMAVEERMLKRIEHRKEKRNRQSG